MQPDELDDLFRQQLAGHATPPGTDLWARLQARTEAEATPATGADPLDAQFRGGLAGHATPPRRELWERLEDEHLRPRQRRRPVVAWGRLAVAASLLLFLLAGGAGLWLRHGPPAGGLVATITTHPQPVGQPGTTTTTSVANTESVTLGQPATAVGGATRQPAPSALAAAESTREKKATTLPAQATAPDSYPSSSPVASTTRLRRPATAQPAASRLPRSNSRPDVAAGSLTQPEGRNTSLPGQPTPTPTGLAAATPAPTELQVIEVEVRRGGAAPPRPAVSVVAAAPAPTEAAPAAPRSRLRLGGLLRQAGHALRGESVDLAEATGLPESVTVQAHLGRRVLSKTIQL